MDMKHFISAISEHHSSEPDTLDFYSSLLLEMSRKNLLDTDFISQMSERDKTLQRLSELLILKYCTQSIDTEIFSENEGPDIIFKYDNRNINIEIVTPIFTKQEKAYVRQYTYSKISDPTPPTYKEICKPTIESMHERITGPFTGKCKKFKRYLETNKISDTDTNIVCINVGFIKNIDSIDFQYLKNLFQKQAVIHMSIDKEHNTKLSILDVDFHVKKDKGVVFPTSYFDNAAYPHIDGAWIINCNDRTISTLKTTCAPYTNIMYQATHSKIKKSMLSSLRINSPEPDGYIDEIREHKRLPK